MSTAFSLDGHAMRRGLRKKNSSPCVYFHLLQTTSHKKISRRGRAGTAESLVPKSVLHMENLLFNFLNFNVFYVVFAAIAVIVAKLPLSFYQDVFISLLGIRIRF